MVESQVEEGIVREVPDERAVAVVPHAASAGVLALAELPNEAFEERLKALKAGRERVARVQRELMDEDVDYGRPGNVSKPTLLKPGAEKLCNLYGLVARFEVDVRYGLEGEPPITVLATCYLHAGSLDGPVVAEGHGAASSWEKRYRWRKGRVCPACGMVGNLIKGGAESRLQGRWWCGTRDGGCGTTFEANDPAVLGQGGLIENGDPYDLLNTLVKMGEKRAHIDATLRGTATSGLFTQDVEDAVVPPGEDGHEAPQDAPQAALPAPAAPAATAAPAAAPEPSTAPAPAPAPARPAQAPRQEHRTAPAPDAARPEGYRPVTDDPGKCPKHNRPWREGQRGHYCSARDDSGRNGYCELKPSAAWVAQQERGGDDELDNLPF